MKLHRAKFSHLENLIAEWSQYVERMASDLRRMQFNRAMTEHFRLAALSSGKAAQSIWREIKAEKR